MKNCALVIGHSEHSRGAVNKASGVDEFTFNDALSRCIVQRCEGVRLQIVYRDNYALLPYKINALKPDFIVSLHCNAFDTRAGGSTVLYHSHSKTGQTLAHLLQHEFVAALALRDRGLTVSKPKTRGWPLLAKTLAPCVIAEPFFIDNDDDFQRAIDRRHLLIDAYCIAIQRFSFFLTHGNHA